MTKAFDVCFVNVMTKAFDVCIVNVMTKAFDVCFVNAMTKAFDVCFVNVNLSEACNCVYPVSRQRLVIINDCSITKWVVRISMF